MRADPETLGALREALAAADYSEARLAARFGIQGALSPDERERPFHVRVLGEARPLSTLVKLFQLALDVSSDEAAAALAPASLDGLADAGLLELRAERVRSNVALHPVGDLFVASDWEREDRAPERPDHVLGPSSPSRSLVALTPRGPVRSALDVGTGCGLQALEAARHAARVVAVDVNPRALELTRLNAVLNGLENVECREGSLFDPVEGERFDLVVCNPPYVVSPETDYVFRDSGLPGDSFCEALVRRLPRYLADGGLGLALVSWVHGEAEDWSAPLRRWVDASGCEALLIRRHSLGPLAYASAWNRILALDPAAYEAALARWLAYYEELRVELIGWGAVVLRRGGRGGSATAVDVPGEPEPGAGAHVVRLLDAHRLRDGALLDARLALPDDHRIAQVLALRSGEAAVDQTVLRLVGGLPVEARLDLDALRLVAELDAGRAAREVLTDPEAGLLALRQLVELGLLVPAG